MSFLLQALLVTQFIHAAPVSMPKGRSIGQPQTLQMEMVENSGPLANFETIEDILPEGASIDGWTDDQVENFYKDQLDFTNYWMDRVQESAQNLNYLGRYETAGKGGRAGLSAIACMSLAIQGEAGAEPMAGKLAVAETVMARAKGRADRVCSVVFAHAQFESLANGRRKSPNAECVRAAHATIKKGGKCGFDHFINKKLQRQMGRAIPRWVINFERKGCATKRVRAHTFYSSCNCKR